MEKITSEECTNVLAALVGWLIFLFFVGATILYADLLVHYGTQ